MPRGIPRKREAPEVQTMNAAPAPAYASPPAPANNPGGYSAPPPPSPGYDPYNRGDVTSAYGASSNSSNGSATMGAPPQRAPQNPFVNAQFLWAYQRPVRATIKGVRDATGTGNKEFQQQGQGPRQAWFLDVIIEDGKPATCRINEGDVRHQKLFAAYRGDLVGRTITLRLSNPGDVDPLNNNKPTKAPWTLDCN